MEGKLRKLHAGTMRSCVVVFHYFLCRICEVIPVFARTYLWSPTFAYLLYYHLWCDCVFVYGVQSLNSLRVALFAIVIVMALGTCTLLHLRTPLLSHDPASARTHYSHAIITFYHVPLPTPHSFTTCARMYSKIKRWNACFLVAVDAYLYIRHHDTYDNLRWRYVIVEHARVHSHRIHTTHARK